MACNPLLKNAETKTRQFVDLPKDSKGAAVKAGAGSALQPREHRSMSRAGSMGPSPPGHRESSQSPAAVSISLEGPHSLGARPRVNLGFLTRASAMAKKRPAGQPCHGPFRSYTKACNYIWVGFK